MGFQRPVMRIFVSDLETPGACLVRLAATTLKPCENLVEYRIQLSLPYILRSTTVLDTTREKARRMPKPSSKKLLGRAVAAILHVTTPSGELANQKLLGQGCADPLSRADRKIAEDQPNTTIGLGIVKVCESR